MEYLIAGGLIVLGAAVFMAVGTLWYGPLFGASWMNSLGKKESDLQVNK